MEHDFISVTQTLSILVIGAYALCSLGVATTDHLRGQPFLLRERGTPLLRSFGDWAPLSLRLLMFMRRAAFFAALVLLLLTLRQF